MGEQAKPRDLLEEQFHRAMLAICESARTECNYRPERFQQMIIELGGLQTARRLLRSHEFAEDLATLWRCNRLDLSMEALVLKQDFQSLFTDEERAIAAQRMSDIAATGAVE